MNKERYVEWIRQSRGKCSKIEFGRSIIHYKFNGDQRICTPYHRNEITNWENGKNLPMSVETVLSIALFAYDHQMLVKQQDNTILRNKRCNYARKCLFDQLGVDLYSRNLHDALLIQVCRRIISFKDVLKLEVELGKIIEGTDALKLSNEQKKKLSLQEETESIRKELYVVKDLHEFKNIITKYRLFFMTAERVLGERLESVFEKRNRYPRKISLEQAVLIYAPNNRQTYKRIYHSSGITRDWLIDLCIHLRFNRAEINYVLKNASMALLSDIPCTQESFIYDNSDKLDKLKLKRFHSGASVGSGQWYQNMEKEFTTDYIAHFHAFVFMTIEKRLCIMILLATLVLEKNYDDLPPIDYLLESFTLNEQGKKTLAFLEKVISKANLKENIDYIRLQNRLQNNSDYLNWGDYVSLASNYFELEDILLDYKDECFDYYTINYKGVLNEKEREEILKLRYLAALFFTVLTGKYFSGTLSKEDLWNIKMQFRNCEIDYSQTYLFIENVLEIFLSNNTVASQDMNDLEKIKTSYCICDQYGKPRSEKINFEILIEDLWQTVLSPE